MSGLLGPDGKLALSVFSEEHNCLKTVPGWKISIELVMRALRGMIEACSWRHDGSATTNAIFKH